LRFLGASRQETFVLGRVLRTVPPAADRAQLSGGETQLLRATAGGRVIGYLYNFRLGDRIYAYQSGFADAEGREPPGIVAHALAIRHAFQSGARVYDFMAGRNRLKEGFSTRCEPMLWQVFQQAAPGPSPRTPRPSLQARDYRAKTLVGGAAKR
jgi:CelD/BcsL family acetyltransferase involved in cellulose biosynthesis